MNSEGRICKALSGFYYVDMGDGRLLECRGRGKFRQAGETPLVGDWVEVRETEPGRGMVWEIRPRRNSFDRPAVANIDQLVIVASAAVPVTDPYLIDRMTAVAALKGCDVVICFNKWDVAQDDELVDIYRTAGFPVMAVSAETGEGMEKLQSLLAGKLSAFTGNTGVGKSSLLNRLEPGFSLPVGDVSEKLGRGRHTTRHVELFRLDCGGEVIDTPGFSSFDGQQLAWELKQKLPECFLEFRPHLDQCRFVGCGHTKEKGCAVLAAVKAGEISRSRHQSYLRLRQELSELREWEHREK